MTALMIPDDIGDRLEEFAEKAHLSKDELAAQVLEEFLEEQEDYLMALAQSERIEKGLETTLSYEEVLETLGLEKTSIH